MLKTRRDTYSNRAHLRAAAKLAQRGAIDIARVETEDPDLGQQLRAADRGNGLIDEPEEYLQAASLPCDRFVQALEAGGAKEVLPEGLRDFLSQRCEWVVRKPDGTYSHELEARPQALYPGSFNPVHHGHEKLHAVAEEILGHEVHYEISQNPTKAPLSVLDFCLRGEQFDTSPVLFNWASLFAEKSRQFPGSTFVIGGDTAETMLRPEVYPPETPLEEAFDTIRSNRCSFLVAAREHKGKLLEVETLQVEPEHQPYLDLMRPIPKEKFLVKASSSDIRAKS